MRVEIAIIKKAYFDNYGPRRFFSADIEIGYYHATYPAIAILDGQEPIIKDKFKDNFNFYDFDKGEEFSAHVIEDGQQIWGFVNDSGHIFSLHSFCLEEEKLVKEIKKFIPKFDEDFPGMKEKISKEDRINSIVALYLLENKEHKMTETVQHYYRTLLLKHSLEDSLSNEHINQPKIKI